MAALTAAATRATRETNNKTIIHLVVGTGETIFAGGLVATVNATGRAVAATAAAGRKFSGIAEETKTGVTAATVRCRVAFGHQALINALTALTTAYVGSTVIVSTDNDVTVDSASTALKSLQVGEVVEFESGDVWVRIRTSANAVV